MTTAYHRMVTVAKITSYARPIITASRCTIKRNLSHTRGESSMDTSGGFLTVKEVADEARVDRSTIYRLCSSGKLEAIRVGTTWRIVAESARALLTSGKETTHA